MRKSHESAYNWNSWPKLKPIKACYYKPSGVGDSLHARIKNLLLRSDRSNCFVVVSMFGNRTLNAALPELISSSWSVHSHFDMVSFGDAYKVTFRIEYDYGQELKIG